MGERSAGDARPADRVRAHYEIERELADRLRAAPRAERLRLYAFVYDELFGRVPDHPQLTRRSDGRAQAERVRGRLAVIRHLAAPGFTFLEIGAGDCSLSLAVAEYAKRVVAIDVTDELRPAVAATPNFAFALSDGLRLDVPPGSIDLAYSDQLLEHLHPDDAGEHAREVHRVLRPGGRYVCFTPSPLTGPHDISKYFSATATGLHLKEYTTADLRRLFAGAGFSQVRNIVHARGRLFLVPSGPFAWAERAARRLPGELPRRPAVAERLGAVVATK
jgi:SAM-dependent methyltransferase